MKKQLVLLAILTFPALLIPSVNAQFKVHNNGHISLQSTTTNNGVQIDTSGRTSIEPNISSSYCRTGKTMVHTNYAKAWIVRHANPAVANDDAFYVLGQGDIYGGSLYSIPANGGGNHNKGIQTIYNAAEILLGLNGYYFENHEFDDFVPDFEGNPEVDPGAIPGLMKDIGLEKIAALDAEELELVFPEAIRHNPQGRVGINYSALIPVLIEAFKEQQQTIELLQKEIADFKNSEKNYGIEEQDNTKNVLYQNTPNPTNSSTIIECIIDTRFSEASIAVYDLNGLQLAEYPIYYHGKNTITIQANVFKPGMYLYSLLVDGKLIDTKRMVITSK